MGQEEVVSRYSDSLKDKHFKTFNSLDDLPIFDNCDDCDFIIFHHTDADGICSAQIVYDSIKSINKDIHIKTVEYNYSANSNEFGDFFSKYLGGNNKSLNCIIVDLSIKAKTIKRIAEVENVRNVLVIDHHITSVREMQNDTEAKCGLLWNVHLYYDISQAATGLCYKLFKKYIPKINAKIVGIIERYDRWSPIDETDRMLGYYINSFLNFSNQLAVNSEVMRNLLYDEFYSDKALMYGRKIYDNERTVNEFRYTIFHKETTFEFEGRKYNICYLFARGNSLTFGKHIKDFDFVTLIHKGKKPGDLVLGLYTDKDSVDVSKIAEHYGGGGHKQAAGCTVNYNIFEK